MSILSIIKNKLFYETFYAGYLAKFMFTKHCRSHKLDPTAEFLKQAGIIYQKDNTEHDNNDDTDDSDDSDNNDESDDEDDCGDDEECGNDEDEDSDGSGDQATGMTLETTVGTSGRQYRL